MMAEPFRLKRAALAVALGGILVATPVWAAPGDPFGGDDTGCTPSTKLGVLCAKKVLGTLVNLQKSVLVCHLKHAGLAFKNGSGTPGFSNAEENCEEGPSQQSAKAVFDAKMASLATKGCDATVLANANAHRDIILSDQTVAGSMDTRNGTFFCDPTTGNDIDPGGDDAGFIPATDDNYKCSVGYSKAWLKLVNYMYKCHSKMAIKSFTSTVFDEEFCEDTGGKSGLDKYNILIAKLVTAGICPSCVTDPGPTNATDLGTSTVADADATLQDVYICPGP